MIIRLTEKINSVCGKYEAAKGDELQAFDYDEKLAIYHCNKKIIGFASDNKIRYEVCKESAEVVQEQKPASDSVLDQFEYNDNGKLEPINKELLTGEKQITSMDIPVGLFEISSGPGAVNDPPSDYHLPNVFSNAKYFDYYMFARAQQAAGLVIDPELAHVQKKLFVPYRGHKSTKQDVIECIKTLQLWLENNEL